MPSKPYLKRRHVRPYLKEENAITIFDIFSLNISCKSQNKTLLQNKRGDYRRLLSKNGETHRKKRNRQGSYKHIKAYKENGGDFSICDLCNKNINYMEVHHMDKNYLNNSPDNLLGLCMSCHIKQHKGESIEKLMLSKSRFLSSQGFIV